MISFSSAAYSLWASVNLELMTASVKFRRKNAPMNTSGKKYAHAYIAYVIWTID